MFYLTMVEKKVGPSDVDFEEIPEDERLYFNIDKELWVKDPKDATGFSKGECNWLLVRHLSTDYLYAWEEV